MSPSDVSGRMARLTRQWVNNIMSNNIKLDQFSFARLRKQLKLSLQDMANLLGLSGNNADNVVRDMEKGKRPISGPIANLWIYLQQSSGYEEDVLPRFLVCEDLKTAALDDNEAFASPEIIFHTRYPRFLAWIANRQEVSDRHTCVYVDKETALAVGMWIDNPLLPANETDIINILEEAAKHTSGYIKRVESLDE